MVFSTCSLKKKQTQQIWLHLDLVLLPKFSFILVIAFISLMTFLSVMFVFPNEHHTLQKTLYNSKNSNLLENNVFFFIDNDLAATKFEPIFCQLSKNQNINVHVVTLGEKFNIYNEIIHEKSRECNVAIHYLDTYINLFDDKMDILSSAFQGMNNMLNKIHPDVFIYSKNLESFVSKSVDAAITASSDLSEFTIIKVPLDEIDHLIWIADLPIESLKSKFLYTYNACMHAHVLSHTHIIFIVSF
jgi:hypothetical protein